MEWLWLTLFGLLGGLLGGMGMGGGTLLIPFLTIFLSVEQTMAQGINLIVFLPMAIFALLIHFKNKLVDVKVSWLIIVFGLISCVGGAFLSNSIDGDVLKLCFAVFLILLGIFQGVSIFIKKKEKN